MSKVSLLLQLSPFYSTNFIYGVDTVLYNCDDHHDNNIIITHSSKDITLLSLSWEQIQVQVQVHDDDNMILLLLIIQVPIIMLYNVEIQAPNIVEIILSMLLFVVWNILHIVYPFCSSEFGNIISLK